MALSDLSEKSSLIHYFITKVGKCMLSGYDVFMNFSDEKSKELNTAPGYVCSLYYPKKKIVLTKFY